MVRTQVSLDANVYRRAQAESRRLGISLAEFVRRALDRALGEQAPPREKPWMRFSGSISGRIDESENELIDAMVYGRER
jgi:Ribbon-helix-helix protein, copG family